MSIETIAGEPSSEEKAFFDEAKAADVAPEPVKEEAAPAREEAPPVEKDEPERQKFVPHQAFHAEREERKRATQKAEAAEARAAKLEEAWQKVQERFAKQDEPAAPKFEDDPAAHLRWQTEQHAKKLAEIEGRSKEQGEHQARRDSEIAFATQVDQAERTFVQGGAADYFEAVKFIRESRIEDLVEFGHTPEAANKVFIDEMRFLAASALNAGKNPAEALYKRAAKYGYKAAEKEPAVDKAADKKLETIESGKKASSRMSGGASESGEMSLEQIADLQGAAFDKAMTRFLEKQGVNRAII